MKNETNRYAGCTIEKLKRQNKLKKSSLWSKWAAVKLPEMYFFLAIVLRMCIVKTPCIADYWSTDVCSNCTRVYVQKPILNQFIDSLVNATKKLKIGDPFEKDTKVGAVINEKHGDKIMDFINIARKEGATVAYGGNKIVPQKGDLKGFFISPCVLTNCTDDMTVVKTEIFGSVVSVLPFDNEDEAIARANALPYGLAAGVMTKDIQRGHRVANSLQAGIVWINNYNIFPPEVPFGGYKLSGYGRENGQAAINDFSQLKTVYVEMNNEIDCPLYG
ncbi:4-trimethylaminobutyraldehyde dehydrogenase like protein [Argiope bruennichi]|uniref:4-trimethylaminobutyraldehyde dehydrogenase like protein n=1 Tax=Argiope bruennichi TaxID=94029 RepID=A0A8T0G5M1_ARGBR|nr:4-trimethylaminobutyraldehyde dehydrogenase like protein [Argiope bruennichi]